MRVFGGTSLYVLGSFSSYSLTQTSKLRKRRFSKRPINAKEVKHRVNPQDYLFFLLHDPSASRSSAGTL
jgi:hypothetical protein